MTITVTADNITKTEDYEQITSAHLIEQSKLQYQKYKIDMPNHYGELARLADIATEECLRQMTKGSDGIKKDVLYPMIFNIIFIDIINKKQVI